MARINSIAMMKWWYILGLGLFSWFGTAVAQQIPTLDFFHGRECPHCQNEKKWFPTLKQAYPDIVINEYEVWHDPANQALMQKRLSDLGQEAGGVPTNIIADTVITGFRPEVILATLAEVYGPPAVDLTTIEPNSFEETNYTWLLIVLASLVVGGIVAFGGKKS